MGMQRRDFLGTLSAGASLGLGLGSSSAYAQALPETAKRSCASFTRSQSSLRTAPVRAGRSRCRH
jgi:hypothetical protein